MRRLATPSPGSLAERLRLGEIANTTVTPSDVWRAIYIWGKPMEAIKGKTTSHKAPTVKIERLPVEDIQRDQELQVDLMYIDKVVFLLSVLLPMQYRFVATLESRSKDDI